MKKFATYNFLAFAFILSSCDSLLDIEASNSQSGDILTDVASFQHALTGSYYNFCGISNGTEGGELMGGDFIVIPELLSRVSSSSIQEYSWNVVLADNAYLDFRNKEILSTNSRVQANWQRAYETINQVNLIISRIDRIEGTPDRDRILGEAYTMRGILLYEMVLLWAPQYTSPLVDPSTDKAIPVLTAPITDINDIPVLSEADVKTIQEVYDQAESDLIAGSTLLEAFGTNGSSLSRFAALSYLAKLNLQKGSFTLAKAYADTVISSGQYSLTASPLDAFNNPTNSTEDIFAIQQTLANNAGDRSSGSGITAFYSSLSESGLGVFRLTRQILGDTTLWHNSPYFHSADVRGSIDYTLTTSSVNTDITTAYYRSLVDNFDGFLSSAKYTSSQYVLPIIRLAELHLIRAEADYREAGVVSTQAVADLNEIRTRAGINAVALGDFSDPTAFFDSLAMERRREFLHEGMLLEDLKRWGASIGYRPAPALTISAWSDDLVLPIPQSELDTWTD